MLPELVLSEGGVVFLVILRCGFFRGSGSLPSNLWSRIIEVEQKKNSPFECILSLSPYESSLLALVEYLSQAWFSPLLSRSDLCVGVRRVSVPIFGVTDIPSIIYGNLLKPVRASRDKLLELPSANTTTDLHFSRSVLQCQIIAIILRFTPCLVLQI